MFEEIKKDGYILIAEDEPDALYLLIQNYKLNTSYRVVGVKNGEEALKVALKETPLVFITDVAMPVMDGTEACAAFKGNEKLRDVPVVLLTAIDNEVVEKIGKWAHADLFVQKPYEAANLIKLVDKLVDLSLAKSSEV